MLDIRGIKAQRGSWGGPVAEYMRGHLAEESLCPYAGAGPACPFLLCPVAFPRGLTGVNLMRTPSKHLRKSNSPRMAHKPRPRKAASVDEILNGVALKVHVLCPCARVPATGRPSPAWEACPCVFRANVG